MPHTNIQLGQTVTVEGINMKGKTTFSTATVVRILEELEDKGPKYDGTPGAIYDCVIKHKGLMMKDDSRSFV